MPKPRRPQPKRLSPDEKFGPYLSDEEDDESEESEESEEDDDIEEFAHPVTAAATDLKNGVWFIHLSTDAARSVHTVQCGPTSLELNSRIANGQVTLSLNDRRGKVPPSKKLKPEPSLPLKVRASYNGDMKEMEETSRGQWAPVSWPYVAAHDPTNYNGNRGYVYATYQLILEFKDASLAEGERHVLTHLSNLLDTQSMADVTFVFKNEKIGAHTAIVVSGSPVICAMLEENKFKEGVTKEVEIDDIDPLVFKEILRYLYTGRAPKLDEDDIAEPLFLAADKYQIEGLKNCCEHRLISKFNLENVVHYLVLAHLYTAPQLLEASLKFLEARKKEVWLRADWKELMKTYPELFFLASHRTVG